MEKAYVIAALETFGGGFAKKLGTLLAVADGDNTRILTGAFAAKYPDYFPGGCWYEEISKTERGIK